MAQFSTLYAGMWHPESVISDGKFFYVTYIGRELDPLAKDGDGTIKKFSLGGTLIENNLSKEPLNAPKGTAIVNNVLYIADLERIIGVDLLTGEKVMAINFSSFGVHLDVLVLYILNILKLCFQISLIDRRGPGSLFCQQLEV